VTSGGTAAASPAAARDGGSDLAAPEGAVGDSLSVAAWTIVSRCTGVLRGVTIAAVLGATYFANTYQFTNSLPNLIFYGLLAGSLFSSLLVPALVPHVDSGDRRAAARTAGSLFGVALLGMLAIVPVVAAATPWLLQLGSLGTHNAAAAHSQATTGAVLVLLLLPQVPLYAVVGTSTAVMNAHRRFALAAAAPALENLGTIAVLGVVAALYAKTAQQPHVPLSLLLLLGAGSTGAVALHASVQWWGARRTGIVLVPRAGWRDPQVRAVVRRALPAATQAALAALQLGALLVVANRIAGGVVAFQLAANFYFLPIAIGATPVALSLMPRLSRMTGTGPDQARLFRDTYLRGLAFASFIVLPAATAYAVLSWPLARAISFGSFHNTGGVGLVSASLLGLAPGIIGETLFLITTYACYARQDTRHPLRGMVIQTAVCAAVIAVVVASLHGQRLLTGLGLGLSAGSICAALYLVRHLIRGTPRGDEPALRPLLRSAACSAIMAGPALATADAATGLLPGAAGRVAAMLAATVVGAGTYFAAQAAMRAPQLGWLGGALRVRGPRLPGLAPRRARAWQASRPRAPGASVVGSFLLRRQVDTALLLACLTAGALAGVKLKYALILTVVVFLGGLVMARPPVAAYMLIFLTPLIVGVNAGSVIPLLRPNEALMVLFAGVISVRWLACVRTGDRRWPKLDAVDLSLIALGVTSSVLPLIMMVARQRAIGNDDLLYSLVLWKLMAEYVIVRSVIVTREQAMRCLWLSMASGAIVCVIGILQSLNKFGVPALLGKYYSPLNVTSALSIGRGSSLLALPAAVADLAILNLAIAVALISRGSRWRWILGGLAVSYAFGVVAAAEFSTLIGMLVSIAVIVVLTRSGRIIAYAIPVAVIGAVLLWPVIQIRLSGFQSASGLPISWLTRLHNLETYFWPALSSDFNWVLGVRPSARVIAPDQEYGYVWIESGYTWLLWGGGIPLLASYIAFATACIRKGWAFSRRADAAGAAGTALAAVMCSQLILMLFDPHLTYRGSGDLLFMLLALVRRLPGRQQAKPPADVPATAAVPRLEELIA
jgi:peptidoglycan biosynthesis protein MviN/MurJ (putative lipid II flippase)